MSPQVKFCGCARDGERGLVMLFNALSPTFMQRSIAITAYFDCPAPCWSVSVVSSASKVYELDSPVANILGEIILHWTTYDDSSYDLSREGKCLAVKAVKWLFRQNILYFANDGYDLELRQS